MTKEQIKSMGIDTSWRSILERYFKIHRLTVEEQASFLACSALTTLDYTMLSFPSNIDGYYKRGFLNTKGKDEYIMLGKLTGIDFENRPELLQDKSVALNTAVYFYKKNKLTPLNAYLSFRVDKTRYEDKYTKYIRILDT